MRNYPKICRSESTLNCRSRHLCITLTYKTCVVWKTSSESCLKGYNVPIMYKRYNLANKSIKEIGLLHNCLKWSGVKRDKSNWRSSFPYSYLMSWWRLHLLILNVYICVHKCIKYRTSNEIWCLDWIAIFMVYLISFPLIKSYLW